MMILWATASIAAIGVMAVSPAAPLVKAVTIWLLVLLLAIFTLAGRRRR